MSRYDALDVLQETFAYLPRKSPGFRLTASMTTLLHPVVKNTSLAILRRKRRRQTGTEAWADILAPPPPQEHDPRSELAVVLAALPLAVR